MGGAVIEKENHTQGKSPQQSIALLLRVDSQPGFGRSQTMRALYCHAKELYPTRNEKLLKDVKTI